MKIHLALRSLQIPLSDRGNDPVVLGEGMVVGGRALIIRSEHSPDNGAPDGVERVKQGEEDAVFGRLGNEPVQLIVCGLVTAPCRSKAGWLRAALQPVNMRGRGIQRRLPGDDGVQEESVSA